MIKIEETPREETPRPPSAREPLIEDHPIMFMTEKEPEVMSERPNTPPPPPKKEH
jgi:hypothetical protein